MIMAFAMGKAIQNAENRGYTKGFAEAAQRDAGALEKAATETRTLIKENIDLTLKLEKAQELLTGNCDECIADGDTCHRDAKGKECLSRVDLALEKAVKAGRVEG